MRGAAAISLLAATLGIAVTQAQPAAAAPATTVTLTASTTQAYTGDTVTFTATVNGDIQSGQYIDIVDLTDGYYVASCPAPEPSWQCSGPDYFYEAHSATYQAYIDNDSNGDDIPPTGVTASSAPVTVQWVDPPPPPDPAKPSDTMCGTTAPLDYGESPVHRKLVVQTGSPTAVCVQAATAGGALVVNAPVPGVPSTDSDVSGCTTVFDDHPAGHDIVLGFGLTSTDVSVCLTIDQTKERVKIPLGGGTAVDWYGDDGSHYGTSGGVIPNPGPIPNPTPGGSCSASTSILLNDLKMCVIMGGI